MSDRYLMEYKSQTDRSRYGRLIDTVRARSKAEAKRKARVKISKHLNVRKT